MLQRKKWELGAIAAHIQNTAANTLEPLDEGKLREEATRGLMDKAKFRMRMEGLSKEQQELVLSEFPAVLQETMQTGTEPKDAEPSSSVSAPEPLAEIQINATGVETNSTKPSSRNRSKELSTEPLSEPHPVRFVEAC